MDEGRYYMMYSRNSHVANDKHNFITMEGVDIERGYKIEKIFDQMTTPINIIFTSNGDMLVADSGVVDGNGKVLKRTNNGFEVIADGFNPPLTGITEYEGFIYVAHRRFVTVIRSEEHTSELQSRGHLVWRLLLE